VEEDETELIRTAFIPSAAMRPVKLTGHLMLRSRLDDDELRTCGDPVRVA
jgi:hypothetical protein